MSLSISNEAFFYSGVTHKNTVLQYLKKQSDQLSHSSGKLLYELIRLVIKLNGVSIYFSSNESFTILILYTTDSLILKRGYIE